MILIIGAPDEAHAAFIHDKLERLNERVLYFDTRLFPLETRLRLDPRTLTESALRLNEGDEWVSLAEIKSVYWRSLMGIQVANSGHSFVNEMLHREIESMIGNIFLSMKPECLWVNAPESIEMHRYKGYQLAKLAQAGLRIPETLMTNDAEALLSFYERMNQQVIFKPIRGGAHTEKLTEVDLTHERLSELAKAPVQFQELIPGVDIRVYLVGNQLFAAEIQATSLDFREDLEAKIVPITLPDSVQEDCFKLAQSLGLQFSGIDIRKTPDNEYVFIEGNPSPMFIHFEAQSGYPISDALVRLLCRGTKVK